MASKLPIRSTRDAVDVIEHDHDRVGPGVKQRTGDDVSGAGTQPAKDQSRKDNEGLPPLQSDQGVPQGEQHSGDRQAPAKASAQKGKAVRPEDIIEPCLHVAAIEEFFSIAYAEQLIEDLQPQVIWQPVAGAESRVGRIQ